MSEYGDDALIGMQGFVGPEEQAYGTEGAEIYTSGEGRAEQMTRDKQGMFKALMMLMMSIRRTDVEMKHLTDNKSLKEFETDLLRVLTLIRAMITSYMVINVLEDMSTFGAKGLVDVGILGLTGITSAGVMVELS